jgi:hypothetical protein
MKRFTLKDLLIGISLIAIGLGMIGSGEIMRLTSVSALCLWLVAWPVIGAGVFYPFKRPMVGAVAAVFFQLTFLLFKFLW